jgi:hypothetical protein
MCLKVCLETLTFLAAAEFEIEYLVLKKFSTMHIALGVASEGGRPGFILKNHFLQT